LNINKVSNVYGNTYTNKAFEKKLPETAASAKVKDQLEISAEAKIMNKKADQVKDLGQIREKIDSGYYNSEKVTNAVVEGLLRDVKNQG